MALFDGYLRDPAAIYRRSFAIIRQEADLARFSGLMEQVAVRVIHACGMPEIAGDLAFSPSAAEAGRMALAAGKSILVDARMVAHGIIRDRLPACNAILCGLDQAGVAEQAERLGTTKSAAGVALWGEHLDGAVIAVEHPPADPEVLLYALAIAWYFIALVWFEDEVVAEWVDLGEGRD